MKSLKSNMKLGSNIINSPPKQSFLVEFNKENECENVAPTKSGNPIKDSVTRTNDESSILDKVELLDINALNLDDPSHWLLDSQDTKVESFDVMAWLKGDGFDSEMFGPKSPMNLANGSAPSLGDQTGSSTADVQYETLKKQAKLLNDSQRDTCISPSASLQSSSGTPRKQKGMLISAETKSMFGIRSPRISSEGEYLKNSSSAIKTDEKLLPLSLLKDSEDSSRVADSSYLNKSFDDVLTAVTSFSSFQSGDGVMQKSFSRSQENCFSPGIVPVAEINERLALGQASGGSMNKLSNVEEVENMARMQADHLRQTVKTGFSSKRLSQSTDRLRHASNYSLMPNAAKKVPTASDSDDSLVPKIKASPEAKPPPAAIMNHPLSLPNIIPQSRIFQAQSKLTSPSSKCSLTESKATLKTTSKISAPSNSTARSQSKIRNVSSTRVQNPGVHDKPTVAADRSFNGTTPPPQRSLGKISSKQVSRLQPPPGHRARVERTSEYDKNRSISDKVKSSPQDHQDKAPSSISSNSPSNHSSTEEAIPTKPSSIPVSKGIPRFSSIPRPKQTMK